MLINYKYFLKMLLHVNCKKWCHFLRHIWATVWRQVLHVLLAIFSIHPLCRTSACLQQISVADYLLKCHNAYIFDFHAHPGSRRSDSHRNHLVQVVICNCTLPNVQDMYLYALLSSTMTSLVYVCNNSVLQRGRKFWVHCKFLGMLYFPYLSEPCRKKNFR